ncbi:MAG: NAD(P)H-hydrate dehydratase [Desulfobacterales bacterium]|nr:NAD(P)H-hydrate dehydratase [Desulfobacterales bacterium]MDX2512339.1 NAD(P)H-hydrate dehydratase [Desulfobacterales bacterium]
MYLVTAKEMQQIDKQTIQDIGIPGRVLMENAGSGAFRFMCRVFPDLVEKSVGVVAGRGNNGGDGFVMARYLSQKNIPVKVYLLCEKSRVQGDARANLDLLTPLGVPVVEIPDDGAFKKRKAAMRRHDIWVDGIFGTGLKSDIKGHYKAVILFMNAMKKPVFAVDIPSGVNADNGQVCGVCIQAQATATFAFPKIGHVVYPGAGHTGKLEIIDIGIPGLVADNIFPRQFVLEDDVLREVLQRRDPNTHKGRTGHLLVIAGSPGKSGAAAMTAMSAMRAGAGLVTLGAPKSLNPVLEAQVTEVMTYALPETTDHMLDTSAMDALQALLTGKSCLAIGPGIGTAEETKQLLFQLLEKIAMPVVIDADGLNILSDRPGILRFLNIPVILTPHPGEMGRLCGISPAAVQQDRVGRARHLATSYHVHVVLKGARTVIAHPDGRVFVNLTGNPGMASGGMGDVLAGVIAGFVAQGYTPEDAAHLGVFLHGAAADHQSNHRGPFGYLATDVMNQLPHQIQKLYRV